MEIYSKIICFSKDTKIATPNGKVSISNIRVGMSIYTYNFNLQTIEETVVERTAKSLHSIYAYISFENNQNLKCTIDHPIYVNGRGFCSVNPELVHRKYGIKVTQLKIGDSCKKINELKLEECNVRNIAIDKCREWFYIISGGENNNFFANDILVHDENVVALDLRNKFIAFSDL